MNYLINEVTDIHNNSYKLYLSVSKSNTKGYVDIRFYSTYSGASNPEAEQTKWKTTIPKDSLFTMIESLSHFAGTKLCK